MPPGRTSMPRIVSPLCRPVTATAVLSIGEARLNVTSRPALVMPNTSPDVTLPEGGGGPLLSLSLRKMSSQPANTVAAMSAPISNPSSLLRVRMLAPCLNHDTYPGTPDYGRCRKADARARQLQPNGDSSRVRTAKPCCPSLPPRGVTYVRHKRMYEFVLPIGVRQEGRRRASMRSGGDTGAA